LLFDRRDRSAIPAGRAASLPIRDILIGINNVCSDAK
jgi:hypothetical protein